MLNRVVQGRAGVQAALAMCACLSAVEHAWPGAVTVLLQLLQRRWRRVLLLVLLLALPSAVMALDDCRRVALALGQLLLQPAQPPAGPQASAQVRQVRQGMGEGRGKCCGGQVRGGGR